MKVFQIRDVNHLIVVVLATLMIIISAGVAFCLSNILHSLPEKCKDVKGYITSLYRPVCIPNTAEDVEHEKVIHEVYKSQRAKYLVRECRDKKGQAIASGVDYVELASTIKNNTGTISFECGYNKERTAFVSLRILKDKRFIASYDYEDTLLGEVWVSADDPYNPPLF